jgi:TetR/AcrR family transcriptional repressor of nem operon|tara:strand:+ start:7662 stop:8255 length:594 start_codon:yes stop_codon:yes gene_type:complete
MAGRPREFDADDARDIAMSLFWSQGYDATSLNDLLSAMGLSKSSFYQTFESKLSLFENCLGRYREMLVGTMTAGLANAPSAIAFINFAIVDVANDTSDPLGRRGCLMMNTATEFAQRDPGIARCVEAGIKATRDVFLEAIIKAQAAGDIDSTASTEVLADYLVTIVSGLKTQVKAGASHDQIADIAKLAVVALQRMT